MSAEAVKAIVMEKDDQPRQEITVEYDFGDSLEDMKEKFGEEVVKSKVKQKLVIDLQAYVRGLLRAGKTEDEITEAVAAWKPGLSKPKKSA